MDFEGPYWYSAVHHTNKPMEPFAIVTINNKYVAEPPIRTTGCMIGGLATFILPHEVLVGHSVCHRCSPCQWLTNLIVVQLVVKPGNNVLVTQPIAQNKSLSFTDTRKTGQHPC